MYSVIVHLIPKEDEKEMDLFDAAAQGDLQEVKRLVEREHVDVNVHNHRGWTALMDAAFNGEFPVVQYLIKHAHADVQAHTEAGWTALMWASRSGHFDVVKCLVEDGLANIFAKNHDDKTACDLAFHADIKEYLQKQMALHEKDEESGEDGVHHLVAKNLELQSLLAAQGTNTALNTSFLSLLSSIEQCDAVLSHLDSFRAEIMDRREILEKATQS